MGKLIVIDGLDGSGKHTQRELLFDSLIKRNIDAYKISFPDYGTSGCVFVEKYLNGEFGLHASDTSAYAASLFFGLDRFYSYKTKWKNDLDKDGSVIIADRYTSANAVHQLSKLPKNEWDGFLDWLWDTEFNKLSLPAPDSVIYLEVKPEVAIKLIEERSVKDNRAMDIHEKDKDFLYRSYEAAMYASEKLSWKRINCCENGKLRTKEDIFSELSTFVDKIIL